MIAAATIVAMMLTLAAPTDGIEAVAQADAGMAIVQKAIERKAARQKGDFIPKYKASSTWSRRYSAAKASPRAWHYNYWCSAEGAEPPLYWWIDFEEVKVEIVRIAFGEWYPGAQFEFFASETKECSENGTRLISGTQEDIFGKTFANGKGYHCYGLKITNLPNTAYGPLASLKDFQFFQPHDVPGVNSMWSNGKGRTICRRSHDFNCQSGCHFKCVILWLGVTDCHYQNKRIVDKLNKCVGNAIGKSLYYFTRKTGSSHYCCAHYDE